MRGGGFGRGGRGGRGRGGFIGGPSHNSNAPPPGPPWGGAPSVQPGAAAVPSGQPGPGGVPENADWLRHGFPARFEVWHQPYNVVSCIFVGEQIGQPAYSGKMTAVTGQLVLSAGWPDSGGAPLASAKESGWTRSGAVITLPDGLTCDVSKNSRLKELGKTAYSFTVPLNGRGDETFEWRLHPDKILGPIKRPGGGWVLTREQDDDEAYPLAVFTDCPGAPVHWMGTFEFVGEGASGQLGPVWSKIALMVLLKAKQKWMLKGIRKGVTLGL